MGGDAGPVATGTLQLVETAVMNTGASVLAQPPPAVFSPGASLAERLFQTPLQGYIRCAECGLPICEVIGDALRIHSRHHGERHVNIIRLSDLGLRLT